MGMRRTVIWIGYPLWSAIIVFCVPQVPMCFQRSGSGFTSVCAAETVRHTRIRCVDQPDVTESLHA
jgi:hypothetical protein